MKLRSTRASIVAVAVTLGLVLFLGSSPTNAQSAQAELNATCNVTGTWIGTVPANGNIFTETIVAEPGGNRFQYTIEGLEINGFEQTLGGVFPGVGATGLSLRGEAVRIGRNTYRFKSHAYGLIDNPPGFPNDYVYLRVDEGVVYFSDCDTQEGLDDVSIYTADQDDDPQDGFPDQGEDPAILLRDVFFKIKRLSVE